MINFLGDRFVIKELAYDKKIKSEFLITIVDRNFKKIKTIHRFKDKRSRDKIRTQIPFVTPIITFQCYSNEIFLVDGLKGFFIEVFDHNGQSLMVIKKQYPKIPISEADKKRIIDDFKKHPFVKERWGRLKKYFENAYSMFPEYYPEIKDFLVADNKIYVKTYNTHDVKEDFLIFDLKGTFLKKTFLPKVKMDLYSISKNIFYYLKENEEQERWELKEVEIE